MSDADDVELILRAQKGDVDAFGELVRRHQAAIYNIAHRMLGRTQDAEDATQEAFLRAYRAIGSFEPGRPLPPWLKRIVINLCINWLESNRVKPLVMMADMSGARRDGRAQDRPSMDDWAHPQLSPEQQLARNEMADRLRTAIWRLPPHYRAVIELRHFQGLSYEAIAETLDRSLNNVKSDLFRARRMLAQFLKRAEAEDVQAH